MFMEDKKLPKTDVKVRPIRTLQDDMAQAVGTQKESAISISVKQMVKKQKTEVKQEKVKTHKKSNKTAYRTALTFLSLFFVIAGSVVIGYFWWQSRPVIEQRIIIDTLVIADEEILQSIEGMSRESFITFVKDETNISKPDGTITNLKLTEITFGIEKTAKPNSFLRLMNTRTPSALSRSMSGNMMFGFIQLQEVSAPFWIVEIETFENVFGATLDWETLLQDDLGLLFSNVEPAIDPVFRDVISKNRDTRILYNDLGEEVMLHSFLDKNTLVITTGEQAFKELLPIFISSKQIR